MKANETASFASRSRLRNVIEPIQWMGTREACERLGVTLRTLYRFIDEGQLPAYKMGRVIRLQAGKLALRLNRVHLWQALPVIKNARADLVFPQVQIAVDCKIVFPGVARSNPRE